MAVRAVIDTNVWVSALLNPHGYPAKLRKAFEEGFIEVIISEPILREIADVLSRPRIRNKYGVTEADIRELLILIEERSEHVLVSGDVNICRDKDDNFIIETAIKGNSKYLVTRDDDVKMDIKTTEYLSRSIDFYVRQREGDEYNRRNFWQESGYLNVQLPGIQPRFSV